MARTVTLAAAQMGPIARTDNRASVVRRLIAMMRQAKAMESCYARLRDVVSKFEERMVRPDAIFKDSLITNIKDECTIMDGLNISNDPELTALVKDIADQLIIPPSVLRTNAIKRESAAVAATVLLQRIP